MIYIYQEHMTGTDKQTEKTQGGSQKRKAQKWCEYLNS